MEGLAGLDKKVTFGNQALANSEIQQLQQDTTELKQIIIQKAEKIYNIGNIDKASFS